MIDHKSTQIKNNATNACIFTPPQKQHKQASGAHRASDVEPRKLVHLRPVQVKGLQQPVVRLSPSLKFQRADRVVDVLQAARVLNNNIFNHSSMITSSANQNITNSYENKGIFRLQHVLVVIQLKFRYLCRMRSTSWNNTSTGTACLYVTPCARRGLIKSRLQYIQSIITTTASGTASIYDKRDRVWYDSSYS